jgi:hypothetical protein
MNAGSDNGDKAGMLGWTRRGVVGWLLAGSEAKFTSSDVAHSSNDVVMLSSMGDASVRAPRHGATSLESDRWCPNERVWGEGRVKDAALPWHSPNGILSPSMVSPCHASARAPRCRAASIESSWRCLDVVAPGEGCVDGACRWHSSNEANGITGMLLFIMMPVGSACRTSVMAPRHSAASVGSSRRRWDEKAPGGGSVNGVAHS